MEKYQSSHSSRGRRGRARRMPSNNITPLGPPPARHRFAFTHHYSDDQGSDAKDEHHQQEQQHDRQQD